MGMTIMYTIIREREYIIMKRTLLFLGMFLSMMSVFAEDNVLQSIEIVPVKYTYNIVLDADKSVDVKKTVKAPNQITLDLKDIRPSKTLNTVYNNVSNVDTVMVEPQGNGVSIFFQAENAADTSISFDSLAPVVPVKETQSIKLNSPVDSYAPIYKEDYSKEKTSALFNRLKNSSTVEGIRESVDEDTVSDTVNKVFSFGLVGLLVFFVARLFKRKEPDMKIGLSQSLNEREIEMYRGQNPIGNSYVNVEKPFTTVNYGINAYQRENRNPYENEAPIHNPRLRNYVNPGINNLGVNTNEGSATRTMSQPQQPTSHVAVKPAVRKNTTPVNTAPVNQSNPNIDNLKFLESMTAIYEKSGRHDLARGLKASLSRNNIK